MDLARRPRASDERSGTRNGDKGPGSTRPRRRPLRPEVAALESRGLMTGYSLATLDWFTAANGTQSLGNQVVDAQGNLFGTTGVPGGTLDVTVYEVARGTGTITTRAVLPRSVSFGTFPSGLVIDPQGSLFGTTQDGGANGVGAIFEVPYGSSTPVLLASMATPSGAQPTGSLVLDADGNLYGAARSGGSSNMGTVFELQAGSSLPIALASFNGANGSTPLSGVVRDGVGNLFGTTQHGGAYGAGAVFEVGQYSGVATLLGSFDGANGVTPSGGVALDAQDDVFGAAQRGGSVNGGTVFEVVHGSGVVTALASFTGSVPALPTGRVVLDAAGNLFGTTQQGGAYGPGMVYEVVSGSGAVTPPAARPTPWRWPSPEGVLRSPVFP
jgi:uncharacterized repeat protein (TIGR03803 family)